MPIDLTSDYYISELSMVRQTCSSQILRRQCCLPMVAVTTVRERSPMEESWCVTIPIATMAMAIARMSMAIARMAIARVAIVARVVSPITNTVMAVASMPVASMSTKSSRTYRSISCTEEGTKGTWVKKMRQCSNLFCLHPPLVRLTTTKRRSRADLRPAIVLGD